MKGGDFLSGPADLIYFQSRKSRRVGTSSKHTETLAMAAGIEKGRRLQESLYEMMYAMDHLRELLSIPNAAFLPLDV
eukprot:1822553-Alexandrium_andersonii.AAC.1